MSEMAKLTPMGCSEKPLFVVSRASTGMPSLTVWFQARHNPPSQRGIFSQNDWFLAKKVFFSQNDWFLAKKVVYPQWSQNWPQWWFFSHSGVKTGLSGVNTGPRVNPGCSGVNTGPRVSPGCSGVNTGLSGGHKPVVVINPLRS